MSFQFWTICIILFIAVFLIVREIMKSRDRELRLRQLEEKEAKLHADMEKDAIDADIRRREAAVKEYYKQRRANSPLGKIINVVKKEVEATGKAQNKSSPLFNQNRSMDTLVEPEQKKNNGFNMRW